MGGCQKAAIACKSRRPNRLKVLRTVCIAPKSIQAEDYLRGKQGLLIFKILHFLGCLSSTTTSHFDCFIPLSSSLQTFFKLSSQAARRSLHRLLKSTSSQQGSHPAILILQHCTAVVQGCRQFLSFGDYSPRRVMKGSPARSWGVENFATIQSTGSSSFPSLHTILVKVMDFLAVLKTHKLQALVMNQDLKHLSI